MKFFLMGQTKFFWAFYVKEKNDIQRGQKRARAYEARVRGGLGYGDERLVDLMNRVLRRREPEPQRACQLRETERQTRQDIPRRRV